MQTIPENDEIIEKSYFLKGNYKSIVIRTYIYIYKTFPCLTKKNKNKA